jgi:predicted transcriptional regulator of viral defense system
MPSATQNDKLLAYVRRRPLVRARELRAAGVTATTIARAVAAGDILRIGRGLYQRPDADLDLNNSLAEVAKQAPRAVICLASALAFHQLTDQLPRKIWIAIGAKDRAPKLTSPQIRTVRFREPYFSQGVELYEIAGVNVRIYSVAKSIADAFRNPNLIERAVAIESLKSALASRKSTPAKLADAAKSFGAGNQIRPYLEALAHG